MKDDRFYLIRASEDIARIEKFTADSKTAFLASELIQGACCAICKPWGVHQTPFSLPTHPISRRGVEGDCGHTKCAGP